MAEFIKPLGLEKIWSSVGVKTPAPDDTKIATGWIVEIPPREYFNYIEYKQDQMLAHINQHGICSWDINTNYMATISYVQGTNGLIYQSKTDHAGVNPVSESGASTSTGGTNWKLAFYSAAEVYTKVETDAKYLSKAANMADIPNASTARANLGVYSSSEVLALYNKKSANLSDVASSLTAFNNVKQAATDSYTGVAQFASDAELLAGSVTNKFVAPSKLKLGFTVDLSPQIGHIAFPSWLASVKFQWGFNDVAGNSLTAASLPSPFATVCLQGVAGLGAANLSDVACPKCVPSGISLLLYNSDNSTQRIRWFAVGY